MVLIALDVGGSSIKSGVVSRDGKLLGGPQTTPVDSGADADTIFDSLAAAVRHWLSSLDAGRLQGIAIAIPGPFDYESGVSLIRSVAKYDSIYGLDVGQALRQRIPIPNLTIRFQNDAHAAISGELLYGAGRNYERVVGVTLGTGLGSAFAVSGAIVNQGAGVPPQGWLYGEPFAGGRADEHFSARGLAKRLYRASGSSAPLPQQAAAARSGDVLVQDAFAAFGRDFAAFLKPYVVTFDAHLLLVLGGIASACDLFGPALQAGLPIPVIQGRLGSAAALLGATRLFP